MVTDTPPLNGSDQSAMLKFYIPVTKDNFGQFLRNKVHWVYTFQAQDSASCGMCSVTLAFGA